VKRASELECLRNGREFRLSVEDPHRHAYVIGQTGSGENIYTDAFDPREPLMQDLKPMLNPVLRYVEKAPNALEFLLLYYIYRYSRREGGAL
jgi:hypothetical protein